MKLLIVITSLVLSSAFAGTMAPMPSVVAKCSNAEGTVRSESGAGTKNKITLKKLNGGDLVLNFGDVAIDFGNVVEVSHEEINTCGLYLKTVVIAAKVVIRPSVSNPVDLTSVAVNNYVETEVICKDVLRSEIPCE